GGDPAGRRNQRQRPGELLPVLHPRWRGTRHDVGHGGKPARPAERPTDPRELRLPYRSRGCHGIRPVRATAGGPGGLGPGGRGGRDHDRRARRVPRRPGGSGAGAGEPRRRRSRALSPALFRPGPRRRPSASRPVDPGRAPPPAGLADRDL
ncbi:MAG: hypothetical protein AVDCRST_MAG41-4684, partial [uncultured Corynebacteriales bacterium]